MEFDQLFNLFEGILWIGISLVLLARMRDTPRHRDLLGVGAAAFFLFGISDFIEIYTRAWYRPWPLLVLKGSCIVTFASCLLIYRRREKRK